MTNKELEFWGLWGERYYYAAVYIVEPSESLAYLDRLWTAKREAMEDK